jgi:hypothetical protein
MALSHSWLAALAAADEGFGDEGAGYDQRKKDCEVNAYPLPKVKPSSGANTNVAASIASVIVPAIAIRELPFPVHFNYDVSGPSILGGG